MKYETSKLRGSFRPHLPWTWENPATTNSKEAKPILPDFNRSVRIPENSHQLSGWAQKHPSAAVWEKWVVSVIIEGRSSAHCARSFPYYGNMENNRPPIKNAFLKEIALAYAYSAKEALAEAFWPTRCVLCDRPGVLLCEECTRRLSYIDFWHRCPRCGAPWGDLQCTECNPVILKQFDLEQTPFSACVSALQFDNSTARIVRCFKDQNEQRLGETLASHIHQILPPSWVAPDLPPVTFIPTTEKAMRIRGFDQGELLAQHLAGQIGAPLLTLFSRPSNRDQRALTRRERIVNMGNRFSLREPAKIPARILIVDDVYTTGATLYAASQTLKAQGCEEVLCATFARVW